MGKQMQPVYDISNAFFFYAAPAVLFGTTSGSVAITFPAFITLEIIKKKPVYFPTHHPKASVSLETSQWKK